MNLSHNLQVTKSKFTSGNSLKKVEGEETKLSPAEKKDCQNGHQIGWTIEEVHPVVAEVSVEEPAA